MLPEGEKCRIDGAMIPLDTGCIGSLECSPTTLTCVRPPMGDLKGPGDASGRPLVQLDDCYNGAYLCVASKGAGVVDLRCASAKLDEGTY